MADLPTAFKCAQCGAGIRIGRHYCPSCGAKVDVNFDEIEKSVEFDKAADTGNKIGNWARTGVSAMLVLGVVIFVVKDCYNEREFPADPNDYIMPMPPNVQSVARFEPARIEAEYDLRRPNRQSTGTEPWPFAYRLDSTYRDDAIKARGGNPIEVKQIINDGLGMLTQEQQKDGSFPVRHYAQKNANRKTHWYPEDWAGYIDAGAKNDCTPVGATALAALCFLGNGDVDVAQSQGLDRNKEAVKNAVKWLLTQQDKTTGAFGAKNAHWSVNHAQATLALIEYTGMTRDRDRLKGRCLQAIDCLLGFADQNGGFAYQAAPEYPPNLDATAWALLALAGAREAGMIDAPRQTKIEQLGTKTIKFLSELRTTNGAVAFDPKQLNQAGPVRDWMGMYLTSVMLLGGNDSGKPKIEVVEKFSLPTYNSAWLQPWEMSKAEARAQGPERAAKLKPNDFFFATTALRYYGGSAWLNWQKALIPVQKQWQDPDDHSFRANDDLTRSRGLVWSTAMNILAAEAYCRIP